MHFSSYMNIWWLKAVYGDWKVTANSQLHNRVLRDRTRLKRSSQKSWHAKNERERNNNTSNTTNALLKERSLHINIRNIIGKAAGHNLATLTNLTNSGDPTRKCSSGCLAAAHSVQNEKYYVNINPDNSYQIFHTIVMTDYPTMSSLLISMLLLLPL